MNGRLMNSHRWPRHRLVLPNAGRSSAEAGLALVEVIIAVGLLVTLAAGVMQLFVMSASALVRARHRTSALILAVEKLEQMRAVALAEGVTDLVGRAGPQTEYLDAEGGTVDARLGGVSPGGGTSGSGLSTDRSARTASSGFRCRWPRPVPWARRSSVSRRHPMVPV